MIGAETILIIGGGPSAAGVDFQRLKKLGYLLGVNDSALNAPCDGVFTMDGFWLKNRWEQVRDMGIDVYARITAFRKHVGMANVWPKLRLYSYKIHKPCMSESSKELWGDNSGAVALNYAYLCRPKRIYLFGFDLATDPRQGDRQDHWYGDYSWGKRKRTESYAPWLTWHTEAAKQFKRAGIEVYNVSAISRIEAYPKIKLGDIHRG